MKRAKSAEIALKRPDGVTAGDHVAVRQLIEDFGRYHYLPRLRNAAVLLDARRSVAP